MIKPEEVYKIGRLGKAHGVKGEVSFQFDDDIFDRVDADYLVLDIDGILATSTLSSAHRNSPVATSISHAHSLKRPTTTCLWHPSLASPSCLRLTVSPSG